MIFINTDVFVIDLRCHRDRKYQENRMFLKLIDKGTKATKSYYNILETCGILSYNLNP